MQQRTNKIIKMKRAILLLAISFILISMITFCKKDDVNTTPTSTTPIITPKDTLYYVQYDGKKYEINNAHIFYTSLFAGSGGCYFYYAYFVMNGVSYSSNFNTMRGTGDGLRLSLIAPSPSNYFGTYICDTINNIAEPNETSGRFYTNSQFSAIVHPGIQYDIYSGTCTITQITSETVLVTGDFKTINNKIIKLNYKGVLPRHEIDY